MSRFFSKRKRRNKQVSLANPDPVEVLEIRQVLSALTALSTEHTPPADATIRSSESAALVDAQRLESSRFTIVGRGDKSAETSHPEKQERSVRLDDQLLSNVKETQRALAPTENGHISETANPSPRLNSGQRDESSLERDPSNQTRSTTPVLPRVDTDRSERLQRSERFLSFHSLPSQSVILVSLFSPDIDQTQFSIDVTPAFKTDAHAAMAISESSVIQEEQAVLKQQGGFIDVRELEVEKSHSPSETIPDGSHVSGSSGDIQAPPVEIRIESAAEQSQARASLRELLADTHGGFVELDEIDVIKADPHTVVMPFGSGQSAPRFGPEAHVAHHRAFEFTSTTHTSHASLLPDIPGSLSTVPGEDSNSTSSRWIQTTVILIAVGLAATSPNRKTRARSNGR